MIGASSKRRADVRKAGQARVENGRGRRERTTDTPQVNKKVYTRVRKCGFNDNFKP